MSLPGILFSNDVTAVCNAVVAGVGAVTPTFTAVVVSMVGVSAFILVVAPDVLAVVCSDVITIAFPVVKRLLAAVVIGSSVDTVPIAKGPVVYRFLPFADNTNNNQVFSYIHIFLFISMRLYG